MEIRLLEEIDMPQFWTLWVRALRDHPTAFGASYAWAKEVSAEQAQESAYGATSRPSVG